MPDTVRVLRMGLQTEGRKLLPSLGLQTRHRCVWERVSCGTQAVTGYMGFPGGSVGKDLPANAGDTLADRNMPWHDEPSEFQRSQSW